MKSIAVFAATLMLGAGAAMAAAPAKPAAVSHHPKAVAVRTGASDRETRALNLLEAKGYGSFTNFRAAGKDFTATVTKDGHATNVRVDPQSGTVTTEG